MRKIVLGIMTFLCVMLVGCETGETNQETGDVVVIEEGISEEVSVEPAASEELVSVEEFKEYYQMGDDVPGDYIEAFIQHRQLTRDSLGERNYDVMVKELYARGLTFGSKIADLIGGEEVQISEEDDFSDVAYIVIQKDIYENGTDLCTPQNIVLEIDNQKVYVTEKSVTEDYTTEENVRDISEEEIKECLQELRSMISDEWNSYHTVESKTYNWRLSIVKEDGSQIYYQGEGTDEVFHPGLEQWCQDYLESDTKTAGQDENVSYYGTWKVWDYQSASVSALSLEEMDAFKGYTLTYEPDAVLQNDRDMNIADLEYTATAYTEETLVQDYRVNLGEWWNGVSEVSDVFITAEEPFFGQEFFVVNDDVIWIYYEGVFFLARKVEE